MTGRPAGAATWGALFERAKGYGVEEADVRGTLGRHREATGDGDAEADGRSAGADAAAEPDDETPGESREGTAASHASDTSTRGESRPAEAAMARVVADADVLAADLLVGGPARAAMDLPRAHTWVRLVASRPLLAEASAIVAELADADLAADWRGRAGALATLVDHPVGDHPALASARRGGARHVLSFDEGLRSAATGAALRGRVETSVKHPAAFARLFDPGDLHPVVVGGTYPGPDRDARD